ncbi:hypothetical protein R0K05_02060 [Planococcus sp. SIMBA_160]
MKKYKVTLLLANGESSSFTTEERSAEELYHKVFRNEFFDYKYGRAENRVRVSHISRVSVVEMKESSGPLPE